MRPKYEVTGLKKRRGRILVSAVCCNNLSYGSTTGLDASDEETRDQNAIKSCGSRSGINQHYGVPSIASLVTTPASAVSKLANISL